MGYQEPKKIKESGIIGDLNLKFEGDKFSGQPILDTKVTINDETLCWISWPDKSKFEKELNEVISKYRI